MSSFINYRTKLKSPSHSDGPPVTLLLLLFPEGEPVYLWPNIRNIWKEGNVVQQMDDQYKDQD